MQGAVRRFREDSKIFTQGAQSKGTQREEGKEEKPRRKHGVRHEVSRREDSKTMLPKKTARGGPQANENIWNSPPLQTWEKSKNLKWNIGPASDLMAKAYWYG